MLIFYLYIESVRRNQFITVHMNTSWSDRDFKLIFNL